MGQALGEVYFISVIFLAMPCSRNYFCPDFRAFIFATFCFLVFCFVFAIISKAEMTIFAHIAENDFQEMRPVSQFF